MSKKTYLSIVLIWLGIALTYGQNTNAQTYDFRVEENVVDGQTIDELVAFTGNYSYHGGTYGLNLKVDAEINIAVEGSCTITFLGSVHSSLDVMGTAVTEGDLGTKAGKVDTDVVDTYSFDYIGDATTLNFKTIAATGNDLYLPTISIEYAPAVAELNGLTEVWDFGAEQLNEELYINNLNVDVMNAWFPGVDPGTRAQNIGGFTNGVLTFVGVAGSDRIRTTNELLTRTDENISDNGTGYTGRLYINSSAKRDRYLSLYLSEDDEVTIVSRADAAGNLVFEYMGDPEAQTDIFALTTTPTPYSFVAKETGEYQIYDNLGKPSYYRIYHKNADYYTLTGTVDVTDAASIPDGYQISFTNEAGKEWLADVDAGSYSVDLPSGYSYDLDLVGANGYVINTGKTIAIDETTTTFDVAIVEVSLNTVTGSITGLGENISTLNLEFTDQSEGKSYVPVPVIDTEAGTYRVDLEINSTYTIAALGVNDFSLENTSISMAEEAATLNLTFTEKPRHAVTIAAPFLNQEQLTKLRLTFSNLHEAGYEYGFDGTEGIALRDGTYAVSYDGLDEYAVELALTSNLKVEGTVVSKTLSFEPVTNWSFDDKIITNATAAYKGLVLTGNIANEIAKGHITAKPEATIQVPVSVGQKVTVSYYYSADLSFDGGEAITTATSSTNTAESAQFIYAGTEAGMVTITIGSGAGTTYISDITVSDVVAYAEVITVGTNKDYQTINEALNAVAAMNRSNGERVTIMIDPGNYEEMLVVNQANVTLKNAAATPDIALKDAGVGISDNAVRITSYYGHGYSYYSMSSDQKWHADVLAVNRANGQLSYENVGSGSDKGSYWNATVVVSASGFEAENIIFENSFNQYISQKESEDVVVMWASGGKGERPTDAGNTAVQNKSFVERAAAISITNNVDKVFLKECRVVGRQDSFYGGKGSRVAVYKGAMMGGTDYLFGGMTAVFYKSDLVMNTSADKNDVSYLTAAQQESGRGYLMYACTVTSAEPGTETASTERSKPGYFGRPWQAATSEVVFFNTTVETSDFEGSEGKSLIIPVGWLSSLGGESPKMYEFGTIEESGEDNQSVRASWSTVLSGGTLADATEITPFNFTKGNDDWDPFALLIEQEEEEEVEEPEVLEIPNDKLTATHIYAFENEIYVSNVNSLTQVRVYNMMGRLVKTLETKENTSFYLNNGLWIVRVQSADGQKAAKVLTR
ncbi:pectinesterase family protein [Reichenbachiella agarivorans]|uniref:Pectinesterase family protein n=1 Tax=Reichenbachiella agarivorans TaxID=2979464 RepID=A0ABY6CMZ9_9BACT|nr:pectinesterase family protein [Reichenbachiella agarivorans]UXP31759.1 pectinesterase family protein [Reichenbachiella agarivorans]